MIQISASPHRIMTSFLTRPRPHCLPALHRPLIALSSPLITVASVREKVPREFAFVVCGIGGSCLNPSEVWSETLTLVCPFP